MTKAKRIAAVAGMTVIGFFALMAGKWYHTTVSEEIDPQRGIFGMAGTEIWIDINIRMPDAARLWACETLLAREAAVLGGLRAPHLRPYGCQPGFGSGPDRTPYETVTKANLDQATAGMDPDRAGTVRACFDRRMASAVTPEEIAAFNADSGNDGASRLVIAANEAARACKADAGP